MLLSNISLRDDGAGRQESPFRPKIAFLLCPDTSKSFSLFARKHCNPSVAFVFAIIVSESDISLNCWFYEVVRTNLIERNALCVGIYENRRQWHWRKYVQKSGGGLNIFLRYSTNPRCLLMHRSIMPNVDIDSLF